MNENARQGLWNGALRPIGYRIVAAEQRGSKIKKKLEIDPLHADTVRLIYRLFLEGDGVKGPMGVKVITCYLNERHISPATVGAGGWRRLLSTHFHPISVWSAVGHAAGPRGLEARRTLYPSH